VPMSDSTVIHNIGALYTCDREFGDGPCGIIRNAWIVVDDGKVAAMGNGAPPAADRATDVSGMCVLPGFVDSHSHIVFGGDRTAEFESRMAGAPYTAGGIMTTVEATRRAEPGLLSARAKVLVEEAARSGTTTIEIKSGYGLDVDTEVASLQAARWLTEETTYLGAHVVPAEFAGRDDDYVSLVCGEMLARCAPHARWIDAFCEQGAFDADQCRAVLDAGRRAGLGLRLHANQLGFGQGVSVAVEAGCASADHCTYLTDADIQLLAGSDTVATFLPATDFSTRHPYPDARRAIDAGVTVAVAANCNPGSSYTTSMPFCLALAVRELGMSPDESVLAATVGGATALRRDDIGRLTPGRRADLVVLDAPSPIHFVYRPGVPIVSMTVIRGEPAYVRQG
jgi:imidazolonepropionase